MANEPNRCPACRTDKALWLTSSVPDESTHEYAIGWTRLKTYTCVKCNARFIVKETKEVIRVNDKPAPNWIKEKAKKFFRWL